MNNSNLMPPQDVSSNDNCSWYFIMGPNLPALWAVWPPIELKWSRLLWIINSATWCSRQSFQSSCAQTKDHRERLFLERIRKSSEIGNATLPSHPTYHLLQRRVGIAKSERQDENCSHFKTRLQKKFGRLGQGCQGRWRTLALQMLSCLKQLSLLPLAETNYDLVLNRGPSFGGLVQDQVARVAMVVKCRKLQSRNQSLIRSESRTLSVSNWIKSRSIWQLCQCFDNENFADSGWPPGRGLTKSLNVFGFS